MEEKRKRFVAQASEDPGSVLSQESEMSIHLAGAESPIDEECDVIFMDELDEKYVCSICERILKKPVQFQECGHRACSECFESWIGERSACPHDETPIVRDQVFTDKAFERHVEALPVKCSLEERGCSWTGVLSELPGHLLECDYRNVICSLKCGNLYEARLIALHEQEECLKRIIQCQFCEKRLNAGMETAHLENRCLLFPIPCPNKCKKKTLPRQEMEDHLQNHCTKHLDDCQFKCFGCEFHGNRKEMKKHNLEFISKHLMMTFECFKAKDQKSNLELEKLKFSQEILSEQESTLSSLEIREGPQFLWKIERYNEKLTEAKSGNETTLFSPKFYTSKYGYCLCLSVCLNGDSKYRGEYMSVFVCLCKSEYDALVAWPFNNPITVTLIDQCPDRKCRRNVVHTIKPNICPENQPFLGRPMTERNACFGNQKFISLNSLNHYEYIKDDTIYIMVSVDTTNVPNFSRN